VQETEEIIGKVPFGSLRLIRQEQETEHLAGELKFAAVEVCGLLPFHDETVEPMGTRRRGVSVMRTISIPP
jgi:hypothetical protein